MKAKISIVEPENVMASITLTMTVAGWRQLREAMAGEPYYGPAQQLREAVDDLTRKVERVIMPSAAEPGGNHASDEAR